MNILILEPPKIPSYFNAGHHLHTFSMATYLRANGYPQTNAADWGSLNLTWKEVTDHLLKIKPNIICIHTDYDSIDLLPRLFEYIHEFLEPTKIAVFGRLAATVPHFFQTLPIDCIVYKGDPEISIRSYLQYLDGQVKTPTGCFYVENSSWSSNETASFLSDEELPLPDIFEIPFQNYSMLYAKDLNRFCGIPKRSELVIPVARGCPMGCYYCEVSIQQGKKERRISVEKTIKYIENAFNSSAIEYVSFYAPTFTLNRRWVIDFCREVKKLPFSVKWKCVTTTYHLDEELIEEMANAGCIRISVGIETLGEAASQPLPRVKQNAKDQLTKMALAMAQNNIELNCFVILGLPGDTPEQCKKTIKIVEELGGRVRPTVYTPYHEMEKSITLEQIRRFNRHFVFGNFTTEEKKEFYHLMFEYPYKETQVFKRIPTKLQPMDSSCNNN